MLARATVSLSAIADIQYGYTASASFDLDGPRFLRITDIQDDAVDWNTVPGCELSPDDFERHKLLDGDIVFARTGATTGKSFLVLEPIDAIPASYLIRVRIRDPQFLPAFVAFYFQSAEYWDAVNSGTSGSAQGGFNASKLGSLQIPRFSLSEQKRIVAILDEAFEGIRLATVNADKNLTNARELFEAQLECAFANVGGDHRRLADIVTRLTNGYVGPTRDIYIDQGVPYLLARHVKENRLTFDGKTFVSEAFNEKHKKSKLKTGDVLLVQSGHIGHSAVVGDEHHGHNCHAMIVLSPLENVLDGQYLSFFFYSSGMKRKFEEIRSGSTVPHLTCGLVRELMIPVPSLSEQRRLVGVLREIERQTQALAAVARARVQVLAALKQSVLCRAFSGQLAAARERAA